MCDDVDTVVAKMRKDAIACTDVQDERWEAVSTDHVAGQLQTRCLRAEARVQSQ